MKHYPFRGKDESFSFLPPKIVAGQMTTKDILKAIEEIHLRRESVSHIKMTAENWTALTNLDGSKPGDRSFLGAFEIIESGPTEIFFDGKSQAS